jgi:formate dehydrogenase major subunit
MQLWSLADADCIIIMGSNMAENHPVGFRFVTQARERGATIIHVDPRFTRTSALSDIYAPIRPGTDIAFLGGMIRYILEHDLWWREFVMPYTNMASIVTGEYGDPEQLDGVFSGFDPHSGSYTAESWQYEGEHVASPLAEHQAHGDSGSTETKFGATPERSERPEDPTLRHPNCVYQILKRHYDRYTPEMVERVTGCPRELFIRICEIYAAASGREKTGSICYAVGWTHHETGVQIIRAASMLQGLLGNIGRPGGGVMALRGHCSIQGSTDIPTLYNMLPTYLPQPNAFKEHRTLKDLLEHETPLTGWWHNFPKYFVSLLKAWYGDNATRDNDFCYDCLPKMTGDHSQLPITLATVDGVVKGTFVFGQNPVVGSVNSDLIERGLAQLEWLVVRDSFETETASFWKKGRLVQRGELKPGDIATEIFLLPACAPAEKDGTLTTTGRLVQWHDVVVEPTGDNRSDLWFMVHLGNRLKELYADSTEPRDRPIQLLTWDYRLRGLRRDPDALQVLQEINGSTWSDKKLLSSYQDLKDDGSTACGGWLYTGVTPSADHNQASSHKPDGPDGPGTHLGWAFTWPSNRREMYNRASADPDGKPWSERKRLVWWDEAKESWGGDDVPDFVATMRPDYRPDWSNDPKGMDALSGADPFIMLPHGRLMLFVPTGLKDGPLPTHYEPLESPVRNPLYRQQSNPATKRWPRPGNDYHEIADPRFPYVFTTYRLTELHCGGLSTRAMPHTAELQPEAFVEIPPELAKEKGVGHLDWVVLSTLRGEIEVKAMLTDRLRPLSIDGRRVYQIGMPWVFGWEGYARGDIANVLTAIFGDANTSIHSTKALTCNLRPGRLPQAEGAPHA